MPRGYWFSATAFLCVALAIGLAGLGACGQSESDSPEAEFTTQQAEALYVEHCASCHALDGTGSVGPPIGDGIANEKYTREEMIVQVRDGQGSMPGFWDRLSESEMAAVVGYVRNDLTQL